MVAVFNKELLSWYLLTLKLKETVDSNIRLDPNAPSSSFEPPPLVVPSQPQTRGLALPPQTSPSGEPQWIISVRGKLDQAKKDEVACPWAKLSIHKVPKTLREGDEKAYMPQIISIGPYHRGKEGLKDMERHKWRSLHHVLGRTGHDIKVYFDSVRGVESKVRACYEGKIAMTSDELVECLVLDGCFLLEVFRGAAAEGFKELGYSRHDPVFAMRGAMHTIRQDMILLENQIPLFVLDCLLALQIGLPPDRRGLVAPLIIRFFDPLMPTDEPLLPSVRHRLKSMVQNQDNSQVSFDPLDDGGLHCLDVFRRSLLFRGPQPTPRIWVKRWSQKNRVADRRRQQLIACVTKLRDAGIKFMRHNTDRFWDVKFSGGVLKVPRLFIHDGSKSLFLNLIAFEQCHVDTTNNITSYVIFMDNLINSGDDVSHLHHCGILEHWLGDDQKVADLFNKLCQEVVFDISDSYLSVLSEQVNRYCNYRWNTWRASLTHNYFGNPWAIMSLVAAVVLLVLTAMQSFYTAYAYYKPPN